MNPVGLLRVLGNKYNAEILQATHVPKSAKELSDELDIPIATVYRRIDELRENNLIVLEGKELSVEGRKTKVYRRQVDEMVIEFGKENEDIDVEERVKNNFVDVWADLPP